jgi:hypothetical protein
MTGHPPPAEEADCLDLQALAQDWITLWHSELAALSADREAQELWRSGLALWAAMSAGLAAALLYHRQHGGQRVAQIVVEAANLGRQQQAFVDDRASRQ